MGKPDYVLFDRSHVYWPGTLPYRGMSSRKGYATQEEAEDKARAVQVHYAGKYGARGGPNLSVVERPRGYRRLP